MSNTGTCSNKIMAYRYYSIRVWQIKNTVRANKMVFVTASTKLEFIN